MRGRVTLVVTLLLAGCLSPASNREEPEPTFGTFAEAAATEVISMFWVNDTLFLVKPTGTTTIHDGVSTNASWPEEPGIRCSLTVFCTRYGTLVEADGFLWRVIQEPGSSDYCIPSCPPPPPPSLRRIDLWAGTDSNVNFTPPARTAYWGLDHQLWFQTGSPPDGFKVLDVRNLTTSDVSIELGAGRTIGLFEVRSGHVIVVRQTPSGGQAAALELYRLDNGTFRAQSRIEYETRAGLDIDFRFASDGQELQFAELLNGAPRFHRWTAQGVERLVATGPLPTSLRGMVSTGESFLLATDSAVLEYWPVATAWQPVDRLQIDVPASVSASTVSP